MSNAFGAGGVVNLSEIESHASRIDEKGPFELSEALCLFFTRLAVVSAEESFSRPN